MLGYMEKGIQTPMAQGRSTKIIEMIKWIRTRRLSIKNTLSCKGALVPGGLCLAVPNWGSLRVTLIG